MRIINHEVWEVTGSGNKIIKLNDGKQGDTISSELYLTPLANCTVVVKGYSDDADTGRILKCIDIANLEKKDSVSAAGTYCYMVSPFTKVEIAVTGTADVIIEYLF